MAKVAFLGLGVMGGPMAGHLAADAHRCGEKRAQALQLRLAQKKGCPFLSLLAEPDSRRLVKINGSRP